MDLLQWTGFTNFHVDSIIRDESVRMENTNHQVTYPEPPELLEESISPIVKMGGMFEYFLLSR